MCTYDIDPPEFYQTNDRVARKVHVCSECKRYIHPKEKYRNVFGKWSDSDIDTYKTCSHCLVAQEWLLKECNGFIHTELLNEISDHAYDYKQISLYRYLIGIERKWKCFKSNELMRIPA